MFWKVSLSPNFRYFYFKFFAFKIFVFNAFYVAKILIFLQEIFIIF